MSIGGQQNPGVKIPLSIQTHRTGVWLPVTEIDLALDGLW